MAITYESKTAAINALIEIEKSEEGYLEKASNANLDSKTANAGHNNYTKYWRDINDWKLFKYQTGWAGGPEWAWCAGFQTWSFVKAFGEDAALKLLLHLPFISCYQLGVHAKNAGQLGDTPHIGDIILFWSSKKNFYHTALVYNVDDVYVYTIEGNTSAGSAVVANGGAVTKKKYLITSVKNDGHKFFTPKYDIVVDTKSTTSKTDNSTSTANNTKVEYIINTQKNPLRCRKKANLGSKVLGKFAKGSTVTLLEKGTKFHKVTGKSTTGEVLVGYCLIKYLTEKNNSVSVKYIVNTQKDPLRCRKEPNVSSSVVGKFAKGTVVTLIEKGTRFHKVTGKSNTGKVITGYCSVDYLKKI